jgi:hypothetical protein
VEKPKPKPKVKAKGKKQKASSPPSGPFINSGKQLGAETLWEGRDIVTGETCVLLL